MKKHEHHFFKHGSKTCPWCGEKFDVPIKAVEKSAKLKGDSKKEK